MDHSRSTYLPRIPYYNGEWKSNNTNCTNAKNLFETIVFRPEDVIKKVEFNYWSTSKAQSYNYLQSKHQWHQQDSKNYGRCFSMVPSDEQIKKGIKFITLEIGVNATIFTHTPGMLLTYPQNKITFFGNGVRERQEVETDNYTRWTLNYELHEQLGK